MASSQDHTLGATDSAQAEREAPGEPAASGDAPGGSVVLLLAPAAELVPPTSCACCSAPAAHSRRLTYSGRHGLAAGRVLDSAAAKIPADTIIIGLCDTCLTHDAAGRTRALSLGLGAGLIGVGLAAGAPMALERASDAGALNISALSWFSHWGLFVAPALVVVLLWLLRWLGARLLEKRAVSRSPACSSAGLRGRPLVSWLELNIHEDKSQLALRCENPRFADQLRLLNPGRAERHVGPLQARSPAWSGLREQRPVLLALLATLAVSAVSFVVHRPRVHVLNLTEHTLKIEVDGELALVLTPTSQESPTAGAELRLPAGRRSFRVFAGEEVVAEAEVSLLGGARHLYAPASDAHCFWLERRAYGRGNTSPPEAGAPVAPGELPVERVPLVNSLRFWTFTQGLDVWLSPPPEPVLEDARSSGGEVTALRQARCEDAPPGARASAIPSSR